MQFVLASESARRVDLLRTAGYDFEPRKSGFPEVTLDDPVETVRANARGKALAIASDPETVVLAADTIVYLPNLPAGERVLGQAKSGKDVERFINLLQGRAHEVYSGVAAPGDGDAGVDFVGATLKVGDESLYVFTAFRLAEDAFAYREVGQVDDGVGR